MKNKGRKYIEINPVSEDGYRWIENIGTAWRFVGYADKIAGLRHTGWFTDTEFQDETLRGVVYKLPSRKGSPVYFVGYADPVNDDAARGEVRTDFSDDNEAAYEADNIAQRVAERECEYNEVSRLGQQYASTFEIVNNERQARKDLFADLRKIKVSLSENDTPAICNTLKAAIRATHRNIRAALDERRKILRDNYVRANLLSAFADGADLSIDDAKALF